MKGNRAAFCLVLVAVAASTAQDQAIPQSSEHIFNELDRLGRSSVEKARFVKLTFQNAPERMVWLITENDDSVTVLQDDLTPWTYLKKGLTTIPSSWHPGQVRLTSIEDVSFDEHCEELSKPIQDEDERTAQMRRLRAPGPSYRVLIAHAARKRNLSRCAQAVLNQEQLYRDDIAKFADAVWNDLAWLHFLRGVNLLMYAERQEVVQHLQLAARLAPEGEHGKDAIELLGQLARIEREKAQDRVNIDKLSEAEKAAYYISKLVDVHCFQMSQPGSIMIYGQVQYEELVDHPITTPLRDLGEQAIPDLIRALEDDRPTRTVYHWRDFNRSRIVWRVSDFAWNILRDITKKDFGDARIVGFTFSYMEPEQKKKIVNEVREWWATSKGKSPDERMFAMFETERYDDWVTAARYFIKKNDQRPVKILVERLPKLDSFNQGEMCELVAAFGDNSAIEALRKVMLTAGEASDRLSAAIGLWRLGDNSGISMVIRYVKAPEQPYGSWDTPVWFLMKVGTPESMGGLKSAIMESSPNRAGEIISFVQASISGELYGKRREPAGSVALCDVLVTAMDREDETGHSYNGVVQRVKDMAATAFVLMRDGSADGFGGRHAFVDPSVFSQTEVGAAKRDAQITSLKRWYAKMKGKLDWDCEKQKLIVKR